jgi:hypothetical protein
MIQSPSDTLSTHLSAARRARTAYRWEEAIQHYTQGLQSPGLTPRRNTSCSKGGPSPTSDWENSSPNWQTWKRSPVSPTLNLPGSGI